MAAMRQVLTGCAHDCGGKCLLVAHVEGDRVLRITGEPTAQRRYHLEPCVRGLRYGERAHHPDRLRRPLIRRPGSARGQADFREASWEEALALVAERLAAVRAESGPGAFLCLARTGSFTAAFHETRLTSQRFFSLFGGHLGTTGNYSNGAAQPATAYTYGTLATGHSRSDWLRSRLLLLWGWDPLVTRLGSHTAWALREARRRGIPIVVVDPRKSATAAFADHWVPIRPGTDVALLNALAHQLVVHGWYDAAFVARHTVGFAAYRDYLLGREDGVERSPEWQAAITGVPADTARWLAREYATRSPAALLPGWAPQRSQQGEQFHRATAALAALAGYVGVAGGSAGGIDRGPGPDGPRLPVPPNPYPPTIPIYRWADCVLRGEAGGYPAKPRVAYVVGGNPLGQHADANKTRRALEALDFVVVHEQFLTPTARWADVVLPATTFLERNDILLPYDGIGGFYLFQSQAVPPPGQARNDWDIFAELAARLGFADAYTESLDEEGWLRRLAAAAGIADFERFRANGLWWVADPGSAGDPQGAEPYVAFRRQRELGEPFPTPSGRIELYSQRLAQRQDPRVPPIPRYLPPVTRGHYPLQLLSPKVHGRINSTLANISGITPDQALWLNPQDAAARGLGEGDWVRVWNDQGTCRVRLRITDGVMPGVAVLPAGSWYAPAPDGTDTGGCPNTLTSDQGTAWSQSSTQQSVWVEVTRLNEPSC